jgi:putative DNA primase/helicase
MIKDAPIIEIKFNSIPAKLRTLPNWVNWKAENRGDKITKIPINPFTLQNAQSNNSSTWASFDAAISRISNPRISGIGFMFTGSNIAGIDLDDVRNAVTGEIEPWALEIIRKVNSYTEISPSGTGIHILVESTLPKEGSRKVGQVEVYDSGRFFTVTGDTLLEYTEIKQREGKELHSFLISVAQSRQVLLKAFEAKNGEKFKKLFAGDWSEYFSNSEADMALASHLYFWTASREETDRLFRQSGLFRPKWDEKHFADGRTYGEDILNKVCKGETYKCQLDIVNNEWSKIIPLDDYSALPDFPIEVLPGLGHDMVKSVSEVNQVDAGMTATIYLSVLSACLAKKGTVNLINFQQPLNIYTCSILPSGNRKSSTMDTMTEALYQYQTKQQDTVQDTIREALNAHNIREARLANLQNKGSA